MSNRIKSATGQSTTRRGLSAGTGVRRKNELRERAAGGDPAARDDAGRASRASGSVERIWRLIRSRKVVMDVTMREERIRRLRRMARSGALENERSIDRGVDGLLGRRTRCEDPGLSRHRR